MRCCSKVVKSQFIFLSFVIFSLAWGTHPAHKPANILFHVTGGYRINAPKINELNPGLSEARYGTLTITDKNKKPLKDPVTGLDIVIRDQHYPLYDFAKEGLDVWNDEAPKPTLGYGIRVIPAANGFYRKLSSAPKETVARVGPRGGISRADGLVIRGSELVDNYLRKVVYNYRGDDLKSGPIFAQITYMHPEGFAGPAGSLSAEPYLKTEMGFTHEGAYLGNGKTVNSPAGYHGDSWWDDGQENYPALLSVLQFRGLEKNGKFNVKAFNQNAAATALIMNETFDGPAFPDNYDYHFDPVYSVSLETVLDFYARWLEKDPRLKTDDLYKTYCAEHYTDYVNTQLNLGQNLASYEEVFGVEDGKRLFNLAMDALYRQPLRSGRDAEFVRSAYLGSEEQLARESSGAAMTPYWKLLGHKGPLVKRQADGSYKATADNQKIKTPGYSLGWNAETVGDLARDFVREYLPWTRVGAVTSVGAILGFASEVQKRMAIPADLYMEKVTPIIQQIFLYEASTERGFAELDGEHDEAKLQAAFTKARARKETELEGLLQFTLASMSETGDHAAQINDDQKKKIDALSRSFTALIRDNNDDAAGDTGWANVSKTTKTTQTSFAALHLPVKTPVEVKLAYREHTYTNLFTPVVAPILKQLDTIDPNPSPDLTVKWYYAPAVAVRVGLGIHDPESFDNVRIFHTAHILPAAESAISVGTTGEIDDRLSLDFRVL